VGSDSNEAREDHTATCLSGYNLGQESDSHRQPVLLTDNSLEQVKADGAVRFGGDTHDSYLQLSPLTDNPSERYALHSSTDVAGLACPSGLQPEPLIDNLAGQCDAGDAVEVARSLALARSNGDIPKIPLNGKGIDRSGVLVALDSVGKRNLSPAFV